MAEFTLTRQDLRIDETYRLPSISQDQFSRLRIMPNNHQFRTKYAAVTSNIKYLVYDDKYLTDFAIEAINMSFGVIGDITPLETNSVDPIKLPEAYENLLDLANAMRIGANTPEQSYVEVKVDRQYMQLLLANFTIYPEFRPLYRE